MKKIDKEMPYANRKLLELVENQADGRVQRFAKMTELSQQRLNRLFNRDKRNGQYPRLTDDVKEKVISHLNLPADYFVLPASDQAFHPYQQLFGSDNITDMADNINTNISSSIEKLTKEQLIFLVKELMSLHNSQTDIYRMLIKQNEEMIRNGQERFNNITSIIFKTV